MRQIVRYRFMTIPNKLYADIRVTIDDNSRAETRATYEGGRSTSLVLLPMINIQILKPLESDGNGSRFRPKGTPNDSIGLTKFNYPTFINELKCICEDMKTPDLYVYRGDRLDLNDSTAERIRRAFIIGRTSIEFRAVVLEQINANGSVDRLEGIKMKFNNEESTVLLTLRELESMIWIMDHADIDNLVLSMYLSFIDRSVYSRDKPVVDIEPIARPVYNQAQPAAYTAILSVPTEVRVEEIKTHPQEKAAEETKTDEPKKKKKTSEEPIRQETVINLPLADDTTIEDDFAKFMNPPVEDTDDTNNEIL